MQMIYTMQERVEEEDFKTRGWIKRLWNEKKRHERSPNEIAVVTATRQPEI